jgi:hypothetical protein
VPPDCAGDYPGVHWKTGNSAKFGCILTKIKDFAVRLGLCGKGGPSAVALWERSADYMTDSTGLSQSLAGLLEAGSTEAEPFDWDTSALADWPNIAPSNDPAPISSAEFVAADFHRAY